MARKSQLPGYLEGGEKQKTEKKEREKKGERAKVSVNNGNWPGKCLISWTNFKNNLVASVPALAHARSCVQIFCHYA